MILLLLNTKNHDLKIGIVIFDPKHANFELNCHLTISLMMCNLKGHNLKNFNFERWKIKISKILRCSLLILRICQLQIDN